jgi:predicted nucleotidyltransferase
VLGEPVANLQRFLAAHGHVPDDLLRQVDAGFGTIQLVVASGSVVAGYANERSDIDLYIVGDVPDTQGVPLVSHELGALLDISVLSATQLRSDLRGLRENEFMASQSQVVDQWKKTRRDLTRAIRLAYGVVLADTLEWSPVIESLTSDAWLRDLATHWWALEAWRWLVSACWLKQANPCLASQLVCDAMICALKAIATQAGYVYFGEKWVALELRAMGRDDLLALYRQTLREAGDSQSIDRRIDAVAGFLEASVGWSINRLTVELAYARGVSIQIMQDWTLVSRWDMRGARLHTVELPSVSRDGRPIWRAAATESPPVDLAALFSMGMLWLGMRDAPG